MRTKLADPEYEPSDDELNSLSKAAFADVKARHAAALDRLFDAIDERRRQRGAPPVEKA
jgi:hypothetical protein